MATEVRRRVGRSGGVGIPVSFRKALGIHAGDQVVLWVEDGELHISTHKRQLARTQEGIRKYDKSRKSLVDEFIAERGNAANRK